MNQEHPSGPALDISTFSLPVAMDEIFGEGGHCALEIGFGEGEFIAEIAKESPGWNFIGIEIKYFRYKKALRLLLKEKITNVRLVHIDAAIAVEQVFADASFDRVYINFPDPWPKDRHKKHRIINDTFLNNLYDLMKDGAVVEFTSDHEEYVEHTLEYFAENQRFLNLFGEKGYSDKVENRPETKFEKDFRLENRKIFYLAFKKLI